jgi:hypothetical protein
VLSGVLFGVEWCAFLVLSGVLFWCSIRAINVDIKQFLLPKYLEVLIELLIN